jgi:hypothetical protein
MSAYRYKIIFQIVVAIAICLRQKTELLRTKFRYFLHTIANYSDCALWRHACPARLVRCSWVPIRTASLQTSAIQAGFSNKTTPA